ncbi:DUF397 domain-containing protein [Amycolatopsis sp. H20-H5]|uniref:DUF397 domain-containing protein n=1 Tax=Amycolatopsis sp. H20-H5 TaxID=3046309 RepID=UPI002DC05904|nr:DUF397 domain-containing protein [Amycolatopsis sp. H20-H5]MEC3979271.1 DUF397 domain-containing protein [Amycolatopsis sp. H20-H5]
MDLDQAGWRKSTRSQGENTACVEVAFVPEVRDSKDPTSPALTSPGSPGAPSSRLPESVAVRRAEVGGPRIGRGRCRPPGRSRGTR